LLRGEFFGAGFTTLGTTKTAKGYGVGIAGIFDRRGFWLTLSSHSDYLRSQDVQIAGSLGFIA